MHDKPRFLEPISNKGLSVLSTVRCRFCFASLEPDNSLFFIKCQRCGMWVWQTNEEFLKEQSKPMRS